ncbi:extracellular solute-binding protein [Actinopolymorpha sp. B11F2]|uniref:ABC transporter substrate-binding protein n=1 Tax=Actinopolymorpha sp. B11F2 TaxID=3160862 RepID=UPI0032E493AF
MASSTMSRRALLAAAGATLAAAGCGGGGFTSAESDNKRGSGSGATAKPTLRMLVNITPNLTKTFWRELVAPFEKANNVTVTIEAPTGEGVKDTLPQLLAAGNPPDVVETLMADATLAPHMHELTGETWVADTPLVEQAALDGSVYTVGVGMQAQSLVFYNKAAFAKAGVTGTPEHFDELTQVMGKLEEAGYLPLQTAGDYVTGLQLLQLAWPSVIGGNPSWYADVAAGKIQAGESLLPYLELYASWLDRGYLDKNALGLKDVDAQTAFFSGKSAMYIMGSWLVSTEATTEKDFEVGVFSAPTQAGQPYPGPMGATMAMPYMVFKNSPNRDQAIELVKWLATDKKAILTQLEQDGNFRAGYDWSGGGVGSAVSTLLAEAPSTTPQGEGYGSQTLPVGFNTEFGKAVQGLYVGRTPEKVAGDLDAWMRANA